MQHDITISATAWHKKNERRKEIEALQMELQDTVAALEEKSKALQDEWNGLTLWLKAASTLAVQSVGERIARDVGFVA